MYNVMCKTVNPNRTMKTLAKLLIVTALAVAVVAAIALKKGKSPVESKASTSTPAIAVTAGTRRRQRLSLPPSYRRSLTWARTSAFRAK